MYALHFFTLRTFLLKIKIVIWIIQKFYIAVSFSLFMVKKKVKKGKVVRNPWFRKRKSNVKGDWGFIPINWKGNVALALLIAVNVFAANYFNLHFLVLDNYLKMGVVFFLSIFVFIEFAKRKTRK